MKGYLYILECSDGTFYTGSTNDIDRRIAEHQSGIGSNYTSKKLPVKLLYVEESQYVQDAFYREKQIQKWSHKKKLALINGDIDSVSALAKKKF